MNLQFIQDNRGNTTGVYIPIEEWNKIKTTYPDIDTMDNNLPDWQKKLIDKRLHAISQNPNSVKPIADLLKELDAEI